MHTLESLQAMGDEEIINLVATQVMGWEPTMTFGKQTGWKPKEENPYQPIRFSWNPLSGSWDDTMQVKITAEKKSGDIILFSEDYKRGQAEAYQGTSCADPDFGDYFVRDKSPQRAICIASILATQ